MTSRFKNLNAQIGAYETYDDELFGAKAAFGVSVLRVRHAETDALREALRGLQGMEDSLPYAAHKTVRADIPIGLYDICYPVVFGDRASSDLKRREPDGLPHAR